jgi:hypothetical protein
MFLLMLLIIFSIAGRGISAQTDVAPQPRSFSEDLLVEAKAHERAGRYKEAVAVYRAYLEGSTRK